MKRSLLLIFSLILIGSTVGWPRKHSMSLYKTKPIAQKIVQESVRDVCWIFTILKT